MTAARCSRQRSRAAGFRGRMRAMDEVLAGLLSRLPAVHALADAAAATPGADAAPRWAVIEAARREIARRREVILGGGAEAALAAAIDPNDVAAAAAALVR